MLNASSYDEEGKTHTKSRLHAPKHHVRNLRIRHLQNVRFVLVGIRDISIFTLICSKLKPYLLPLIDWDGGARRKIDTGVTLKLNDVVERALGRVLPTWRSRRRGPRNGPIIRCTE